MCTRNFIVIIHNSQKVGIGGWGRCPSTEEWIKKEGGIFIQWNTSS